MIPFFKKKKGEVLRKKATTPSRRLTMLQLQLIIGFLIVLVVGLVATAIWYTTRIQTLQIAQVHVVGGQTIPHKVIEDKVTAALAGSYLKLVPKRFGLFYPKTEIEESIKMLDRVKNVQVERSGNQTVTVVFDEYTPYALWCEAFDSATCFFIDSTGFAFAQAPVLEGSAFVRYVEEGSVPALDEYAFDSSFIDETKTFIESLTEKLSLYVIYVSKVGEYDVEYTISGGGVIKVSQTIPMIESFKNLETILNSEEFIHIVPGSFQYIDLRFGDKVFVNEEPPAGDVQLETELGDESQ